MGENKEALLTLRANIKQALRSDTYAGNPVNYILRPQALLLTVVLQVHIKMEMEIPGSRRLKKFKKDDYTSFQDKERYEHAGLKVTSSQVGKRSQDDDKRFDLADNLKEAQDHSLSCK
ncbi:hypothetical protein Tco_0123033 [Tanacetum coccineum]